MDQESFRKLLEKPHTVQSKGSTAKSRGSLLEIVAKPKTVGASQPAFKPRKVKKLTDSQYRDRAAERRTGEGNDYAHVEAVLEDFEQRTANTEDRAAIEEQRRYLGGDSEHSILVKGVDLALLEQNKARAGLSTEDDDSLEKAFLEVASEPAAPTKRTREEIVRELKEKRRQEAGMVEAGAEKTAADEGRLLEEAKKAGKFKPIGFKPVGGTGKEKVKKGKEGKGKERDGERKKKKRKLDDAATQGTDAAAQTAIAVPPAPEPQNVPQHKPPTSEAEPMDDDFDIFAGAGEYEGIDVGDEEEDGEVEETPISREPADKGDQSKNTAVLQPAPGRWFATEEDVPPRKTQTAVASLLQRPHSPAPDSSKQRAGEEDEEEDEDGDVKQPTRLAPLASSVLPSIKDFLAMDQASGKSGKRKKGKGKKKDGAKGAEDDQDDADANTGKKAVSAEARAERDYKRLKTYTEKKASAK